VRRCLRRQRLGALTVYDLSVRELGAGRTLLSGLMRTASTDEHARL
jgi:hypothetical protein